MPEVAETRPRSKSKVGVVVLNYKNYSDTIECLETLAAVDYPNLETVVVDNDSGNGSLDEIAAYLRVAGRPFFELREDALDSAVKRPEVLHLVQASKNWGYAVGNNIGIRLLLERDAGYIVILNNDTMVEPGFIQPLVDYLDDHPEAGAVGPLILDTQGGIYWMCARRRPLIGDFFFRLGVGRKLFPHNRWLRRDTYEGELSLDGPKEVEVLSGSCMMLRGTFLRDTGLLDENTFLYAEEIIIYERLTAMDLVSVIVPASRVVHKHARASATVRTGVLQAAFEQSISYYWTEYRHLNRFVVAALLFISRTPRNPFRRRAKAAS
jgi:GT2 family glycosyltransferase